MNRIRTFTLIRVAFPALLATVVAAGLLSAEDFAGKFTLPFEAKWGLATLPPGDYAFRINPAVAPYTAQVQREGKVVAIITASQGRSESGPSGQSQLIVVRRGKKGTIHALQLADPGVVLTYTEPKAERQLLAQAPELIQRIRVVVSGK
jgi:hypothetical protein